jgi:hypothetical protein
MNGRSTKDPATLWTCYLSNLSVTDQTQVQGLAYVHSSIRPRRCGTEMRDTRGCGGCGRMPADAEQGCGTDEGCGTKDAEQTNQPHEFERRQTAGCGVPMASLIRDHQIAGDLPTTVSLVLPHRQIVIHQALAAVEGRLCSAPFVDKVTLLTRSPRLYRSRASPSEIRKLSSHMSFDLKPSPETLSCGTAVNGILRIRRANQCYVPRFHSIDPRPGPRLFIEVLRYLSVSGSCRARSTRPDWKE